MFCDDSCDQWPKSSRGRSRPRRWRSAAIYGITLLAASWSILAGSGPAWAQAPTEQPVAVEAVATAAEPVAEESQKTSSIPSTPTAIIRELGYFLIPFVIASVIAMWFAIERIVMLRRARVIPRPFVERFLQLLDQRKLDPETALRLCEENPSPVAAVFAHGIRKWGKPSVEVEQAIIDGGERQVAQLRQHLRVINGVATVAPLLGLLGTVIGMIQAFNQIANSSGMGKAEELAVGIALALLTTAAGLVIAIPSLILYMYLAGRVDSLVLEMDELAQDVVEHICAESLTERADPRRTRPRSPAPVESKESA